MSYLLICVGVTAIAVLIQIGALVALFISVRNSISRIEALFSEVKTKVVPVVETAKAMVAEIKPNVTTVVTDVAESTKRVRRQIARVDAFAGEVAVRTRLQFIRSEEFMNRAKDHIEETSNLVQRVAHPIRRLSALFQESGAWLQFFRRCLHLNKLLNGNKGWSADGG